MQMTEFYTSRVLCQHAVILLHSNAVVTCVISFGRTTLVRACNTCTHCIKGALLRDGTHSAGLPLVICTCTVLCLLRYAWRRHLRYSNEHDLVTSRAQKP